MLTLDNLYITNVETDIFPRLNSVLNGTKDCTDDTSVTSTGVTLFSWRAIFMIHIS